MRLESLRVIHLHKKRVSAFTPLDLPDAFLLDSCQRRIWVCTDSEIKGASIPAEYEVFAGKSAYLFLLRVATGLESMVPGETDIFGQVKEAWKKAEIPAVLRAHLSSWMQRIFEDTKEIRFRHLQNLGGASYGSLVRLLLRDQWGDKSGPILLVGAGALAQSIAPYLAGHEVWLLNRNPEKLKELHANLLNQGAKARIVSTSEEEEKAWKGAAHAVLCIPVDPEGDARRIQLWNEGSQALGKSRPFVHLGGMKNQCGEWTSVDGFHCLDEIFDLQRSQGDVRSVHLSQAGKACEERAKLRALGGSVSIHHGWEDLAVFA